MTVQFSTAVSIASTATVTGGSLDLGGSTVNVRGSWVETGGQVRGGTSRTVFDGSSAQSVTQLPGSSFGAFVSSSAAGLSVLGTLNAAAQLEWRRGALNFAGRAVSIGGDMTITGGSGLSFAGSTVTLSGASTQTINFPSLDHVIVDNPNPVKLGVNSSWGTLVVNPGRYFDGVTRTLTITGDRWATGGASYGGVAPQHTVTWNPPSSITVGADSTIAAKVSVEAGKTALLQGNLTIDGPGNALEPRAGSTIVNAAGGSTITFKVSSDLSPASGANWFYAGDVGNSWLVYEGTGGSRGAYVSTVTLGSVHVALSNNTSIFQPPDMNLLGTLAISTGIVRPLGSRTISLEGSLLQTGGLIDYNTASTGTIRFVGGSTSTISLLAGATIWNLVADGTGTVQAASFLRVRGDFAANSGVFRAGSSSHSFQTNFIVGPGGRFEGETSTVTFDGTALGRINQNVTFLGGGQFWGVNQAVSSLTFLTNATAQYLVDSVPGSTITVLSGATLRVDDFRMGFSTGTPLRLRSSVPGAPFNLRVVTASSVTLTAVSDADASAGITVRADDGRAVDLGGNTNWDFNPNLLVILPGETFTPGVAPGKSGAPAAATAGAPISVTVRAVSSRFDQVTKATEAVSLATNDPGTAAPAPQQLVLGATAFLLTPRGAEPSPRATLVTASAAFGSGNATVNVVPDALARLQIVLPGETAFPGDPTGKSGIASARVRNMPFSATVRAVDAYFNLISTITDVAALSISASSATLPAPQALVAGQATFSGLAVHVTGVFTLSATDVTAPAVQAATSTPFGVSPPSSSSPTLSGFVPDGARVATLAGGIVGVATDVSAVEQVLVDLRDLDAGLHFDWSVQAFGLGAPSFTTAALGSPLTQGTTWFRGATDSAFTDGRRFRLTARATNPTGLTTQATSTFTFDRGMLAFGAKDGQGAAAVLPLNAAGCEELVSTVTLTIGASGIAPGGAIAARAPEGWTLPYGTTTTYPPPLGYWHVASTSLASSLGSTAAVVSPSASGSTPLGPGWLLLTVSTASPFSFLPGQDVVMTYRARPPFGPAGRGPQSFAVMTRGDAGGTLLATATAPFVSLGAGNTSYLSFADPSPLSLAPLSASATMQLAVVDLCGNPRPGVSSGTISLSLHVLSGGGATADAGAQFFNAGGAPITSVFLSTGLAPAASPSFSVWTSTDAPAELVIVASGTFSGVGFSTITVQAARPVRLRASLPAFTSVSIDSGTLVPGATSVALSAGDPASTAVQIRFRLADSGLTWEAAISSDAVSFSSPAFSATGLGDPDRTITLGWDGLDRWRDPPGFPAPGRLKVRLRAGGGAAVDRTLEVVVPPTAGYAGRLGARGAGARVRASGPGADGRWAVASSTGYFELRGLRPGQAYALAIATATVALGRPLSLSTELAAGAASVPLADLGVLAFPATAQLRVSVLAPAPAPREVLGGFIGRLSDGSAAFSGPLRLSSAAASSDDGGPLFGRAASTWSVAAVAAGSYAVDIEIPDLGVSTRASVVVGAGGADLAVAFAKKANVSGWIVVPSTQAFGSFVSVQATRAGASEPAAFGGAFVSSVPSPAGPSSAPYALFGLDPGSWTVLARAPGFAASSAALVVSGTSDLAANLALGLGARVTGSVSVSGDATGATQCFPAAGGGPGSCPAGAFEAEIEALAVGRLDRAATRVRLSRHVSFSSAAFTISGLDAGTWTLRTSVPGMRLSPAQGSSVTVTAGGTAAAPALALAPLDARLRVDVLVPPLPGGACRSTSSYRSLGLLIEPDAAAARAWGDATAMAPTPAAPRIQVDALTGAFALLHCSSATFFTPALAPGGARASALFAANGGLARARLSLADGTTAALTLDVSGSTYAVTGNVSFAGTVGFATRTAGGAPFVVSASSVPGLLASAPHASFCLLGSGNPLTLPALRVELLPWDASFPPLRRSSGTAAGLCAAPAPSTAPAATAAYLASVNPDGTFAFAGVSPGLYRVRVPGELDEDRVNGPEAAEDGALISVGTGPATASLRLARGRRVSGRISAPLNMALGRALRVVLLDETGAEARRTEVGSGASGADYALDGVPDGRYRLVVSDLGEPAAWTAAPLEITVAGADLDRRDAALVPAAAIRARLSLARPLADGSEEHVLVSRENAFLLPRGFSARATAVPYVPGASFTAKTGADGSILDGDGRVVFAGLLPGVYDVEFAGPDDASPGAVAFAAARVSGVRVDGGQAADLGVVPLFGGAAAAGAVTDAATGLPVAGALISARASLRAGVAGLRDGASARTDAAGRYVLRGLSPETRWYDLTVSAAGLASRRAVSVDLSSGAAQDFALSPAPWTAFGRVVSADGSLLRSALATGAAAPGAALYLQRAGVPPNEDPLADLALRTGSDGRFTIPSLSSGSYRLTITADGQESRTLALVVASASVDLGTVTLGGAGSISGTLRLPDGAPVPDDELRAVAAATTDLSEFLYGSTTRDAAARGSVAYKIGGLRAGRTYRVMIISPFDDAVEAASVVLTSTSEARVLNLVVRPPRPGVSARSRQAGAGRTVEFLFSRPLRSRLASDEDPSLAVSTVSGAGALSGASLSADRRTLTVRYDPGVGESSFTLRASAATTAIDYDASDPAARELLATATAQFFVGETGAHRSVISNAVGGTLVSEGDAGRIVLPRGAFGVDASSSVAVTFRRASAVSGVSAASMPAEIRAAAAALPASLPARSDFYEIELPAGVPSVLARPARMTIVWSSAVANPSALNLYWYNPASGQYVLQPDALGGAPALDASARTFSINVGHFSTFVLLDSAAPAIGGSSHGGELEAYNFPNPFDLQVKTVTTIHGAGAQTVRGTMIRVATPPNLSGAGKLKVFDAAGRLIRTIDMGQLDAGRSYYQGWDGRNDSGRDVASGLYIGLVEVGSRRKSFKMAVIK